MVQNVSAGNQNQYGSINRIGMTNNGRVIYQVIDAKGKITGKMSVAQKDCDTFERSYNTMMTLAPKIQHYAQATPPEKIEKKQKMAKWIVGCSALLGGIYPLLKTRGEGVWGFVKQLGLTLLGTGIGLAGGVFIASKTTTPPGAKEFAKATQTISKLDIQPVQE